MKTLPTGPAAGSRSRGFLIFAAVLAAALAALFHKSFLPQYVIYSNDAPLGLVHAHQGDMPEGFKGTWHDLNFIGEEYIAGPPDFSLLCRTVFGAVGYSKFMAPIAMFLVGCCAWLFFRQLGLSRLACILGGLAAGLNSEFFSTACWGIVAQPVNFAANFLALAALANPKARWPWARYCLAGFAVGWGVMEGFDIGAIFSLFTAAFVVFQAWNTEDKKPAVMKLGKGILQTAIVAICAGIIATQAINSLVGTQIKSVAGMEQDAQTKKARWVGATMWSLPELETLQTIMPGFFGYRMANWEMYSDDKPFYPDVYWGSIGSTPQLPEIKEAAASPDPARSTSARQFLKSGQVSYRFSGGGLYDGVLVALVALWAIFQSFRGSRSAYSLPQRRSIWFWFAMAFIALLLAYGCYAPFYQLFYALPYASTIRNPAKFMHVFSWIAVILFAHGVHGLSRAYLENPAQTAKSLGETFKSWWAKAAPFEKNWLRGSVVVTGAAILAGLIFAGSTNNFTGYLEDNGFDATQAPQVAHHATMAFGWFLVLLTVSAALVALIMSGWFAGGRLRWGGILMGALLVADLSLADKPWIVYFDYPYKYETNPVIDLLRDKPYEHRLSMPSISELLQGMDPVFFNYYHYEWKQQTFPYYNIQDLDVIQSPRESVENQKFMGATQNALLQWELTNTRYLIVSAAVLDSLNRINPAKQTFRVLAKFAIEPRKNDLSPSIQDYKAVTNSTGPMALIEDEDALPRAQLYSAWQVMTNEDEPLKLLPDPRFDPHHVVLVSDPLPAPSSAAGDAGTVTINDNYRSKRVELEADVKAPSVLLLNDRFNPDWKVTVDGKPETMLRCNYVMRGVYLPQTGKHTIVFNFEPPIHGLYVSLAADAVALVLLAFVVVCPGRRMDTQSEPAAAEAPARTKK